MPQKIELWKIQDDKLECCKSGKLDIEARLEKWVEEDISILSPDLMIIGRQVTTDFGGAIDLLCLDRSGDLVIVELKRDKTPRDVTAQVLDYASWVHGLSHEDVTSVANNYLGRGGSIDKAFSKRFNSDLPETLNEHHSMLIVGSRVDPASERIIGYLSTHHAIDINAVTFQYLLADDGSEMLARVFLRDPRKLSSEGSKRRRNLTWDELKELADAQGVLDSYNKMAEFMTSRFGRRMTRSSVAFTADFDSSNRAVFNLIPGDSSPERGIHFQLYLKRLCDHLGISDEEALALLPVDREKWTYLSWEPDWSGYAGYFSTDEEIDHFLGGIEEALGQA